MESRRRCSRKMQTQTKICCLAGGGSYISQLQFVKFALPCNVRQVLFNAENFLEPHILWGERMQREQRQSLQRALSHVQPTCLHPGLVLLHRSLRSTQVWFGHEVLPAHLSPRRQNLQWSPVMQGWPSQALTQSLCNLSLRQTFAEIRWWSLKGAPTDPALKNILHVLLQGISPGFWASLLHAELRLCLNPCRVRDLYLNY